MEPPRDRWSFRFGDALPAADVRARFVVSVGAALNDLIFLNRLHTTDPAWGLMRREGTSEENVYLIRLVSSAVFELGRLIEKGRAGAPISELLDGLSPEGTADLGTFVSFGKLRPALRRVRDTTSHYPWPTEERLTRYLEDLADWEGDFIAHPSSMASIRATFADTVLLQSLVDDGGEAINDEESKELLKDLVQGLTELAITGIRLCQHIIATYVATLPPGVVRHHPGEG